MTVDRSLATLIHAKVARDKDTNQGDKEHCAFPSKCVISYSCTPALQDIID